ncbi:MAG: hypothetical protein LKF96_05840 [Treponema sp.]|jgi:hypothetical protein|nr:hypothetical protein [Treponema sp.]
MEFFLYILMPLVCLFYYIHDKRRIVYLPVTILSLVFSAVFCGLKAFFSFSYRIAPDNFFRNYAFFFLSESFIPVVVITGLLLGLSRDSLHYRVSAFFAAALPYYAICIPYRVLSAAVPYPFFGLFIKPLLYLSMVVAYSIILELLYGSARTGKRKQVLFSVLGLIFVLCLPAFVETLWFSGKFFVLQIVIFCIYEGGVVELCCLKKNKTMKEVLEYLMSIRFVVRGK